MSWIGRFTNQLRRRKLTREIDEELESHLEEAVARGRTPQEARRALGSRLRLREQSRDYKLLPWLDALASDVVFGWRQLNKHRTVSAAAILSLALAIGATTAAFRLVDAVLLRSLPVADPDGLYYLATTYAEEGGRPDYRDDFDYPTYRSYREILAGQADLMVVGNAARQEVLWSGAEERERIDQQYVSGNVFGVFGLRPALGRLLTPEDDTAPGAHPVAVLSYAYWTRRLGRDPATVGGTFQMAGKRYEVVGVAPEGFTGTEPGVLTDVYMPATMRVEALDSPGWTWFRLWVRPKPGVTPEQIRQPLEAAFKMDHQQRLKGFPPDTPRRTIDAYLSESMLLFPAASGASDLKKGYRRPLLILAMLVALVLLIACANVGNLLTAQTAARAREMALRVSVGAGKLRLTQLLLVESALLAVFASAGGALFSWWSAPFVVSMLAPAQEPVRLVLEADGRTLGFGAALTVLVTMLLGLAPAIRAGAVQPVSALKGGEDPRARRRLTHSLIAAQMAFCVTVLFLGGLFVATFERLSHRPLGFVPDRVLLLDVEAAEAPAPAIWTQLSDHLRRAPGVESASSAGWALMSGNRMRKPVRVPGGTTEALTPNFLEVSAGFFETMRIGVIGGRDFRAGDLAPRLESDGRPMAGVGIVNEAFARTYFDGRSPLGRRVEVGQSRDRSAPMEIIGYVRDAVYRDVHEPIPATVYIPMENRHGTVVVRAAGDAQPLAPLLRREIPQAFAGFRVPRVFTQSELVGVQMLRERLLAALSLFFSVVALALAGIGVYGVLNYAVIKQRREFGIRLALGARPLHVVRRAAAASMGMVALGSLIGLTGGLASAQFVEALLFEVKASDAGIVTMPIVILLFAAALAALPPAIRAARIDPAETLRNE